MQIKRNVIYIYIHIKLLSGYIPASYCAELHPFRFAAAPISVKSKRVVLRFSIWVGRLSVYKEPNAAASCFDCQYRWMMSVGSGSWFFKEAKITSLAGLSFLLYTAMQRPPESAVISRSLVISRTIVRKWSCCCSSQCSNLFPTLSFLIFVKCPSLWYPQIKCRVRPNQSWGRESANLFLPELVFTSAAAEDGVWWPRCMTRIRASLLSSPIVNFSRDDVTSVNSVDSNRSFWWSLSVYGQQISTSNRTTQFKLPIW